MRVLTQRTDEKRWSRDYTQNDRERIPVSADHVGNRVKRAVVVTTHRNIDGLSNRVGNRRIVCSGIESYTVSTQVGVAASRSQIIERLSKSGAAATVRYPLDRTAS